MTLRPDRGRRHDRWCRTLVVSMLVGLSFAGCGDGSASSKYPSKEDLASELLRARLAASETVYDAEPPEWQAAIDRTGGLGQQDAADCIPRGDSPSPPADWVFDCSTSRDHSGPDEGLNTLNDALNREAYVVTVNGETGCWDAVINPDDESHGIQYIKRLSTCSVLTAQEIYPNIPGPSTGAPEDDPVSDDAGGGDGSSSGFQHGCETIEEVKGSIPCSTALAVANDALATGGAGLNDTVRVRGYDCYVYPYAVECTRGDTKFITTFGLSGDQTG